MSSLDNWDGTLSVGAKQNKSRLSDLVESPEASTSTLHKTTTVPDERSNTLGNGHGLHDNISSLDLNFMVCYLLDGLCIVAQVAVYLVRRVKFE
jgi:hypothetical protein